MPLTFKGGGEGFTMNACFALAIIGLWIYFINVSSNPQILSLNLQIKVM